VLSTVGFSTDPLEMGACTALVLTALPEHRRQFVRAIRRIRQGTSTRAGVLCEFRRSSRWFGSLRVSFD